MREIPVVFLASTIGLRFIVGRQSMAFLQAIRNRPGRRGGGSLAAKDAPRDVWAVTALVPVTQDEAADLSTSGCIRIEALLARALRSERRRGQSGHWSYDLKRHLALVRALKDERARLARHRGRSRKTS